MILFCYLTDRRRVDTTGPGAAHGGEAIKQSGNDLLSKGPIYGFVWVVGAVKVDEHIFASLDMGERMVEV